MIPASMKHPSAFVPVVMSLAALAVVVGHAVIFGITPPPGSAPLTRIFQLLMAAQLPVVLFLVVTRLRRNPMPTARILASQAAAALAALAADFLLTWQRGAASPSTGLVILSAAKNPRVCFACHSAARGPRRAVLARWGGAQRRNPLLPGAPHHASEMWVCHCGIRRISGCTIAADGRSNSIVRLFIRDPIRASSLREILSSPQNGGKLEIPNNHAAS